MDAQTNLGLISIEDTKIDLSKKNRHASIKIGMALLTIFKNSDYRNRISDILEDNLMKGEKDTGRPGMSLWQIFVLSQYRLGLNLSYDELTYRVNNDYTMRCLWGIQENMFATNRIEWVYQQILDNVGLLTDEMVDELCDVIVCFGHAEVFKKRGAASTLKTDSYVLQSDVKYPTDYNLLWDGARKSLDMAGKLIDRHSFLQNDWRKKRDWYKRLKSTCRHFGQVSRRGGKNKAEQLEEAAISYLKINEQLVYKIIDWSAGIPD